MKFKFDKRKYTYSEKAAKRVINFIERYCTHTKGQLKGKPFILADWQKEEIIKPGFGILRKTDKRRRFRTIYVEIPKKNGKSALGSAFALYLTAADGEGGAEVYSAAGSKEQARIIFRNAQKMIEQRPTLKKAFKVFRNAITHEKSGSFYHVLSADVDTSHGPDVHGLVFDELHVQKKRDLYDFLVKGTAARKQPLIIILTTAGLKNSFAETIHDYAVNIRDGIIKDDTFLPVIYSADPEDIDKDPFAEKVIKKANPNYGVSIEKAYFKSEINQVRGSPSGLNNYLRLHLNIWTGAYSTWIDNISFAKCKLSKTGLKKLEGRECYGGLDLASVRDLSSFSLMFPPEEEGGVFEWLVWFWCPEDTVDSRTKKENVNYGTWVRQGLIKTCGGTRQDHEYIKKEILAIRELVNIKFIGFDRWNAIGIVNSLIGEGLQMQPFSMGLSNMSAPTKELENLILGREINHGGNPVLAWQMGNVTLVSDSNDNVRPDKDKSKDKIDGIVSGIIALGTYLKNLPQKKKDSVYKTRGLRTV